MIAGGKRPGAGRPKGTGKYGVKTKPVGIPCSEVNNILDYIQYGYYRLPFYQCAISAGFPSPAEDESAERLDLNELLVKHPSATFFLRVSGTSMIKAGIHHNDILIVDRSIEPAHGKIVIACVNGELTVKRLLCERGKVRLAPENDGHSPIDITENMDLRFWGVVTSVIHAV